MLIVNKWWVIMLYWTLWENTEHSWTVSWYLNRCFMVLTKLVKSQFKINLRAVCVRIGRCENWLDTFKSGLNQMEWSNTKTNVLWSRNQWSSNSSETCLIPRRCPKPEWFLQYFVFTTRVGTVFFTELSEKQTLAILNW